MLPEFVDRVPADRAELQAGETIPVLDGVEPLIYVLLTGCLVLLNRYRAAAAVSWPGDLVVAPTEGMGATMLLKAAADSVCLRVRRSDLLAECSRQPEIALWIWGQQQQREAELHRRLELLTAASVERRVIDTVADLAVRCQAAAPGYAMPLAQNEVANLAGATRETTSTLLNCMRRRGMVELGRRHILVVAAPEVLRTFSTLTGPET